MTAKTPAMPMLAILLVFIVVHLEPRHRPSQITQELGLQYGIRLPVRGNDCGLLLRSMFERGRSRVLPGKVESLKATPLRTCAFPAAAGDDRPWLAPTDDGGRAGELGRLAKKPALSV